MKISIPYKPRYPDVHERLSAARYSVLVAHRRFGKTVLAINHLIRAAVLCGRPRGHFGYVAPMLHQARTVCWDYLLHFTAKIPGRVVSRRDLAVNLPSAGGGARVRLFGASNPDALRGLYFDGVVLDEVAQMKAEVWEEIILPALADRQGWAVFIGTPQGHQPLLPPVFPRRPGAGRGQSRVGRPLLPGLPNPSPRPRGSGAT